MGLSTTPLVDTVVPERLEYKFMLTRAQARNLQPLMDNPLIQSDPNIMMGRPVIAGTRITVELVLEKLASGESIEEILEAHPRLTREGILAAFEFAAKALRADVVYPTADQSA